MAFGFPLLLNGILMFGIFQGDRIIVGSQLGVTELGWFSAAFIVTLTPTLVLAKTLQSLMLPQLARAQHGSAEFQRLYLAAVEAALLIGVVLAVLFALVGPGLLTLLFSSKYESALSIIAWLGVMQGVRVAKAGPAIVAVAKGRTTNPFLANLARVVMLPVAWIFAHNGAGVPTIVAVAILGECFAFGVSLFLISRVLSLALEQLLVPVAGAFVTLALIGLDNRLWPPGALTGANLHLFQVLPVVATLLVWWSMRPLRQLIYS